MTLPHTKQLHLLPFDETRKALVHAIEKPGYKSWLMRNRAQVYWEGQWAVIGYDPPHTRIQLTIELPDPSGNERMVFYGSSADNSGEPWQVAFDSAMAKLLNTLAQRLVDAKRSDEASRLVSAMGFE